MIGLFRLGLANAHRQSIAPTSPALYVMTEKVLGLRFPVLLPMQRVILAAPPLEEAIWPQAEE